ncbi:hypothetical protein JXI42_12470 [bacterium]|nr:hypothetical protein [bacterium]
MEKCVKLLLLLSLTIALFLVGCSEDDDDNGPNGSEGPNYKVTAVFDIPVVKNGDSLFVEVERLIASADSPEDALIILDSIELLLVEYDSYEDIATFATDSLTIAPDESYSFSFTCGDDSAYTDIITPPATQVHILSPRMEAGDTTLPTFSEGSPVPVNWEYEGDVPPNVKICFAAVKVPDIIDYCVILDGEETSYIIEGDSTDGFGGHGWPPPTIFVAPVSNVIVEDAGVDLNVEVDGWGDITFINLLDVDTTGTYTTPAITVTGGPGSTTISWDPPIGAMMLTVYRNSENHGQDHTGQIWLLTAVDPLDGFVPPVSYGVIPEGAYGSDVEEEIIEGEEYSVLISWLFEPGIGNSAIQSWSTSK